MKTRKRNIAPPRADVAVNNVFTNEQKKIIAVAINESKLAVVDAMIETLVKVRAEATYAAE
jgi:hypothetical protein